MNTERNTEEAGTMTVEFFSRCAAILRQLEPSGPWEDCPGCGGACPRDVLAVDEPWAWHKPDCEARALVEMCESGEHTFALEDVPALLRALPSDEMRREVLRAITEDFCTACGRIDPRCQCENDE